jgi:hypothetical protein
MKNIFSLIFRAERFRYVFSNYFNLSRLFEKAEKGAVWPCYNSFSTFTTHDGSTLASIGDDVGRVEDDTPNNFDLVQSNSALRGKLQEVSGSRAVRMDLVDDAYTSTLSSSVSGQIVLAGSGGQYVEDVNISAGNSFNLGPTSWTGGIPGILRAVHGSSSTGGFIGATMREGTFTESELSEIEKFYKRYGAKGLLVESNQLLLNTSFSNAATGSPGTAPTSWGFDAAGGSTTVASGGQIGFSTSASRFILGQSVSIAAFSVHIWEVTVDANPDGNVFANLFFPINRPDIVVYYADDVEIAFTSYVPTAGQRLKAVLSAGATPALSARFRIGVGTIGVTSGSAIFSSPSARRFVPRENL